MFDHNRVLARRWLILVEVIELTLAVIFVLVGNATLIGRPDMILLFSQIGVGQWFRYLTGTIEVTGALLLINPFLAGISAIALGAVMIVASLIELFILTHHPSRRCRVSARMRSSPGAESQRHKDSPYGRRS